MHAWPQPRQHAAGRGAHLPPGLHADKGALGGVIPVHAARERPVQPAAQRNQRSRRAHCCSICVAAWSVPGVGPASMAAHRGAPRTSWLPVAVMVGTSLKKGLRKLNQASHTCTSAGAVGRREMPLAKLEHTTGWTGGRPLAVLPAQAAHRLVGAGGHALKAAGAGHALDAGVGAVPVPGVGVRVLQGKAQSARRPTGAWHSPGSWKGLTSPTRMATGGLGVISADAMMCSRVLLLFMDMPAGGSHQPRAACCGGVHAAASQRTPVGDGQDPLGEGRPWAAPVRRRLGGQLAGARTGEGWRGNAHLLPWHRSGCGTCTPRSC